MPAYHIGPLLLAFEQGHSGHLQKIFSHRIDPTGFADQVIDELKQRQYVVCVLLDGFSGCGGAGVAGQTFRADHNFLKDWKKKTPRRMKQNDSDVADRHENTD